MKGGKGKGTRKKARENGEEEKGKGKGKGTKGKGGGWERRTGGKGGKVHVREERREGEFRSIMIDYM